MEFFKSETRDPVILALCTQEAFQKALDKAKRRVEKRKKPKLERKKKPKPLLYRQIDFLMITSWKLTGGFIKIDVKDNNVEQAIRVLKRKLQKEGFFKVMKMKSTYEKPSEKKKRVQTENLKRIKKLQKLKNRY